MIVYEENPNNGYIDDSFSNDELDSETEIENALAIINTEINEKIIKSGYLKKKGEKRKAWKKRWFVLRSNRLSYYKNEKEYKLLKVIRLDDILSVNNFENQQKYIHSMNNNKSDSTPISPKPQKQNLLNAFYVNTNERPYLLQAQSIEDRDQWIKALNSAISGKKTNAFNPQEFLTNNNLISSSKAKDIDQKLNQANVNDNTLASYNTNMDNSHEKNDTIETEQNILTEEDEINKINQMIQKNIALQIPKVNVKEDYSKVYYINNMTPKIQKAKTTKAVNFSTSAPSVHILMDEESDDDTEELRVDEDEDDELSYEEFKKTVVKDENGDYVCSNEENLEFFNSDEILNVIEKKLKFENEMNLANSSSPYGNYSMTRPIAVSKRGQINNKNRIDLLSREKLDMDDDDDDDDDEDDEEEDEDDDYMLSSSYDEHNSLYSQRKEYLKEQMEKDVIIQQGYMYKYRKNALKKKWKKYWFVIRSGNLFIYKNEQEYVVKSIIPLENTMAICEVKRSSRIGRKGKKNRVRYCFQLIQSINPKMPERHYSVDSVNTVSTNNTDLSNEPIFTKQNNFAEPNEISSSYSSTTSLQNQSQSQSQSQSQNSNSSNINNINTMTDNTINSTFALQDTIKIKRSSISQLTNKIKSMHNKVNSHDHHNDCNNTITATASTPTTTNNNNNNIKENNLSSVSTNNVEEEDSNSKDADKVISTSVTSNINNSNNSLNNNETMNNGNNNTDVIKKKTTSILKINTNNKRLTGNFDSYNNNFEDGNRNSKYKRNSLLASALSPSSNMTPMTPKTPKRKTFVKVFTFSAPTETSRKIWIANLLNECEKVQEVQEK
jgi:hypothetical protein